jgi:hypothetical protein
VTAAGNAVRGISTAAAGQIAGVTGSSDSTQGRGVYGVAWETPTIGATYGVFGESYSNNGIGVFGRVPNASGSTVGGDFFSASTSGRGVRGIAGPQNGTGAAHGGEFESRTINGRGVWGKATATSGVTYGVFGSTASPTGYGVWSQGDLQVVGDSNVSGVKAFRIDHPLDPANKFLLHFSAEGPEPQNIYNGIVTLDDAGRAVVELPHYFASINRDPRYHLTCIGGFAPVYIAEEIDLEAPASRFTIAGGRAGLRISWEVKAARNDPYTQSRIISPEIEKREWERDRYLHPELHGQPPQRGINYQPR